MIFDEALLLLVSYELLKKSLFKTFFLLPIQNFKFVVLETKNKLIKN